MNQPVNVFEQVLRPAKIATLRSIAYHLLRSATIGIQAELKREEETARTIDGFNDDEASQQLREEQQEHTREVGHENYMTVQEACDLYVAIGDELTVIGTSKYDYLEPWHKVLERQAAREFNPNSEYAKREVAKLVKNFQISEEHALKKLTKRNERFGAKFNERLPDIIDRLETRFEATSGQLYDVLFAKLAPEHQLRLLDVAIKGLEREVGRLKDLDMEYDWDDMLQQAKTLSLEVNTFIEAKRPLISKAQAVEA